MLRTFAPLPLSSHLSGGEGAWGSWLSEQVLKQGTSINSNFYFLIYVPQYRWCTDLIVHLSCLGIDLGYALCFIPVLDPLGLLNCHHILEWWGRCLTQYHRVNAKQMLIVQFIWASYLAKCLCVLNVLAWSLDISQWAKRIHAGHPIITLLYV